MSSRQGSASYTSAISVVVALIVGAIVLTFFFYPIVTAMMNSAFWGAETNAGARVVTFTGGVWTFWGAIILIALIIFIWVKTRQ